MFRSPSTHPGLDAHAASLSAVASSALVRLVAQRRAGERLRSGRSREPGQRSAPRTAAASVQGAHPRPCALWRVPSKSLRPPKEPMPPEAHQRPGRGDWQTPSTRRQCHQHRRRLGGAGAAWRRVLGPAGSGARRHALPKPSRLARTILMDFTSTMRAASHAHHTCLKPECRDFHQAARCPCVARGEAPGGTSGRIL